MSAATRASVSRRFQSPSALSRQNVQNIVTSNSQFRAWNTDGGFRPDGTFVSWPAHDTARVTEAFRRAVLRLFVRLALFDEDQAAGMLTWPHSGFHVHTAVCLASATY
jgi:hypothetical protein